MKQLQDTVLKDTDRDEDIMIQKDKQQDIDKEKQRGRERDSGEGKRGRGGGGCRKFRERIFQNLKSFSSLKSSCRQQPHHEHVSC